ncbi:MAG TPA: PEGA domain-containing protein [Kiritimatiellia bacterium]|nr:PEGA domain-containing protein [Kiritimatiellia bacterium]
MKRLRNSICLVLALACCGAMTSRADDGATYATARARLDTAKREQLGALLEQQLRTSRARLNEAMRTRNPADTAAFSEAIRLLESAERELRNKGDFTPPESRRAALAVMLAELKAERDKHHTEYTDARAALDARYPDAARAFSTPTTVPRPSARISNPALTPAPPAATTTPPPAVVNAPPRTPDAIQLSLPTAPALADNVIAQRGESTNWVPVGRWTATMKSEALIGLQVFNRQGMTTGSYFNPIEMVTSDWSYEALRRIPPGGYPMRIVHLPDHAPITLDQWPSPDGRRDLTIRVRFAHWPLQAGFQLEADGSALPPPPAQIRIPVRTLPPGARVLVDGVEVTVDGLPVETPCEIVLSEGNRHEIRLRREGQKEAVAPSFLVAPGARIQWRFEPAP